MKKKEKIIQEHTLKKTRLSERIQQTLGREREIHQQNGKKLEAFDDSLIEYLKSRSSQWNTNQINALRQRSESFGAEIFSRLENIQETFESMKFDENNFSNNSQTIKKLNREIAIEAEELIGLAEKAMNLWQLNKDRLEDYSKTLIKVIEAVEFSSLLNSEKLEYKISNLTEFSEDLRQLNEEIKALKVEDGMLRAWINKLQNENNELKELKPKELAKQIEELKESLENVTEERDEFEQKGLQFQKEIQVLKGQNKNLTEARDQLIQEKDDLVAEKEEISDEKDGLSTTVETLKKEKIDLVRAQDELTQEKAALSDTNAGLEEERDDLKGKVEALTKEKDGLINEQDQFKREKAELVAKNKELEGKSPSE